VKDLSAIALVGTVVNVDEPSSPCCLNLSALLFQRNNSVFPLTTNQCQRKPFF
jgi:hypothetical protein